MDIIYGVRVEMPLANCPENGPVAQLGEHLLCKEDVEGSSPFRSTKSKNNMLNSILPQAWH